MSGLVETRPADRAAEDAGDRGPSLADILGTGLVGAGMFFAPLVSLQPITPPPVVTYADVFLVTGFLLLIPRLLRQPLRAPAPLLLGAFLLMWFALLAITLHPDVGQSVSGALRLGYAAVALPLALLWWNPSPSRRTILAACYFLGSLFSLICGLVNGPRADGRYLGLGTQPNGFGISLALGLSLVPYLASRMPSHRWLPYLGAAFGAYGVWISGSRAAFAVLALLLVAYLLIERSAGAFVLLLLGALVLATTWAQLSAAGGDNALARLAGTRDSTDSDAQRRGLLSSGLHQISDHPLLGGGFDQIRAAHNIYVQIGAAIGLVALAGFLLILLCLVLPVFTAPRPMNRLAYPALVFVMLGPITDTLSDTSIWAAVSLAVLAVPERKGT